MTTIRVRQAHPNRDRTIIRDLFWEYLTWANDMNDQAFGLRLDIAAMLEEDLAALDKFMPPSGRLLLSEVRGCVAGCICLKRLSVSIGEVKRLYVVPNYRGRGIGREMVGRLLGEARQIGYSTVRLDSTVYMTKAHKLYRSFGFCEIDPYRESEIPAEYHAHWVFMETDLG